MFVPTHELQSGIFPFKTDVKVDPGKTWFFSCGINAYHLMDKLSFHAQYVFASHSRDKITLIKDDSAFKMSRLTDDTVWKVQAGNIGFNYDIAPNMAIGVLWQAPLARRAAYKTNTIMLSYAALF